MKARRDARSIVAEADGTYTREMLEMQSSRGFGLEGTNIMA